MSEKQEFSGRRALVTGGSRGIGAAIAQRFLDGGATVVVTARGRNEATPKKATLIEGDVRTNAGAKKIAAEAIGVLWRSRHPCECRGRDSCLSAGFGFHTGRRVARFAGHKFPLCCARNQRRVACSEGVKNGGYHKHLIRRDRSPGRAAVALPHGQGGLESLFQRTCQRARV